MARKKKPEPEVEPDEPDEIDGEDAEKDAAPPAAKAGLVARIVPVLLVTIVAIGVGIGSGYLVAGMVEAATTAKAQAQPENPPPVRSVKYSGDLVIHDLDPIVTNLAAPSDTWIRLETAMIFKNGEIENPQIAAAEIRQDIVAYARTLTLDQLEGASALQHLGEDLNERVAVRTAGRVSELILQSLVVQ